MVYGRAGAAAGGELVFAGAVSEAVHAGRFGQDIAPSASCGGGGGGWAVPSALGDRLCGAMEGDGEGDRLPEIVARGFDDYAAVSEESVFYDASEPGTKGGGVWFGSSGGVDAREGEDPGAVLELRGVGARGVWSRGGGAVSLRGGGGCVEPRAGGTVGGVPAGAATP